MLTITFDDNGYMSIDRVEDLPLGPDDVIAGDLEDDAGRSTSGNIRNQINSMLEALGQSGMQDMRAQELEQSYNSLLNQLNTHPQNFELRSDLIARREVIKNAIDLMNGAGGDPLAEEVQSRNAEHAIDELRGLADDGNLSPDEFERLVDDVSRYIARQGLPLNVQSLDLALENLSSPELNQIRRSLGIDQVFPDSIPEQMQRGLDNLLDGGISPIYDPVSYQVEQKTNSAFLYFPGNTGARVPPGGFGAGNNSSEREGSGSGVGGRGSTGGGRPTGDSAADRAADRAAADRARGGSDSDSGRSGSGGRSMGGELADGRREGSSGTSGR